MTVELIGHDYRYAAEQMLLTLFPHERPTYESREENHVSLSLRRGAVWVTATAVLHYQGRISRHACRARVSQLTGGLEDDRVCQRILKLAFYRAGVEVLGREPGHGGRGHPSAGQEGTAENLSGLPCPGPAGSGLRPGQPGGRPGTLPP